MSDDSEVRNEVQAWLKKFNITCPISEQSFRIPGTMKSERVPCYIVPVVEMNRLYNAVCQQPVIVAVGNDLTISSLRPANQSWVKWDGNYEKKAYDVWVSGCDVVLGCWPNDGKMCATDDSGREWTPEQVLAVRVSDFQHRYPKPEFP